MSRLVDQRRRARSRAVQAIYQWQINDVGCGEILRQFTEEQDFSNVDEDYFNALVRGVVDERDAIDAALKPHLDRPITQVDDIERAILRMAGFELLMRPDVPWKVVINEAVDLAKRFGADQGHAYINGVLDAASMDLRQAERDSSH